MKSFDEYELLEASPIPLARRKWLAGEAESVPYDILDNFQENYGEVSSEEYKFYLKEVIKALRKRTQ